MFVATPVKNIPISSPLTPYITSPFLLYQKCSTLFIAEYLSPKALAQLPGLFVISGQAYRGRSGPLALPGSVLVKPNLRTPLQLLDIWTNRRYTLSFTAIGRLLKHIDLQKLSALRALDLSELKATLSPCISWNCIGQSVVSPVKSALSPTIEKWFLLYVVDIYLPYINLIKYKTSIQNFLLHYSDIKLQNCSIRTLFIGCSVIIDSVSGTRTKHETISPGLLRIFLLI